MDGFDTFRADEFQGRMKTDNPGKVQRARLKNINKEVLMFLNQF